MHKINDSPQLLSFTGRDWDSHITQIAAISYHDSTFSYNVFPEWPISTKASRVTGLKVRGQQLFHKRKSVSPLSIKDALQFFVECLKNRPYQVILIVHNIKVLDCDVLMNDLQSCHLKTQSVQALRIFEYITSLQIDQTWLDSYTQVNLVIILKQCFTSFFSLISTLTYIFFFIF